jgi:HEAT repeat protein
LSVHEEVVGAGQAVALELAAELAAADGDSRLHDDVIRAALRRGLRHAELSVRIAAARGLATFATAADAGRLVAVAASGPEQLARAAAKALSSLGRREPDAVKSVLSMLELDQPGSAALTELIGEISGDESFTKLSAAISADDSRIRIAAITAFVKIGGSRAAEQVGLALADENVEVQAAAARALGELRDDEGRPVAIEELLMTLTAADPSVRAAAARALAGAGETRAIEPLRDLLREESPGVALAAMEALRALSDPALGDLLVEALGHHDDEVVKEVLSAIYETGGPRTASRLTVGLSHPSWDVRRHAAALVGAFGGDDARAALTARLSIEEDDLVRDALSGALEEMDA